MALAIKYGYGGLLNGIAIFCGRARSATYAQPLFAIGQEIFSFVVEMNNIMEKNLLDKEEEEGSPLVHAVKSKLIN